MANWKVLVTSTSFQDTPGPHQDLLNKAPFSFTWKRGPLNESEMLDIIQDFDALLCGDDALTADVLKKGKNGRLKFISKYGVGLDKIDLPAARELNIPVTNCPGVNQVSVAEHFFGLLLGFLRNIPSELDYVMTQGQWKRLTGTEIFGKNLCVLGLGRIGKEITKRAHAFGMNIYAFDLNIESSFVSEFGINIVTDLEKDFHLFDFVSLNLPLLPETRGIINSNLLNKARKNLIVINTARGELIEQDDIIIALKNDRISGYLTDVLDVEPMPLDHPLRSLKNVMITPHIGSRTFDSVSRQGTMAVENLLNGYYKIVEKE
jgi:D-3-phosphoglycerate dehydrogenase